MKAGSGRIDMLTFKIAYGGKGHAVNLFNNGKITFTGGYPEGATDINETPRRVLEIAVGNEYQDFKINSVTAQFEGDFEGSLQDIARVTRGEIKQHFVSIPSMRIYSRGTIQVSGIKTQRQFETLGDKVQGLISLLINRGAVHTGIVRERIPVRTRPQARQNNQIAPDVATRSTTCPKDRRPDPYSFAGAAPPGYYVGVNPQGQPCCYKIPQRKEYLRNKIKNRFAALGLKVPNSTREIFNIQVNNANKPANVSGHINENLKFFNSNTGFKIGTRQATRYSLTRLLNISRRIGVAMNARGKSSKMSKQNIINSIRNWAVTKGKLIGPGTHAVVTNTNVRIGPRMRLASTYTKSQLVEEASKLGIHLNPALTMKDLVSNLRSRLA